MSELAYEILDSQERFQTYSLLMAIEDRRIARLRYDFLFILRKVHEEEGEEALSRLFKTDGDLALAFERSLVLKGTNKEALLGNMVYVEQKDMIARLEQLLHAESKLPVDSSSSKTVDLLRRPLFLSPSTPSAGVPAVLSESEHDDEVVDQLEPSPVIVLPSKRRRTSSKISKPSTSSKHLESDVDMDQGAAGSSA